MTSLQVPDRSIRSGGSWDHGWSLFISTIGDNDPREVSPELLFLRRGVSTNAKTGERKYGIVDFPVHHTASGSYTLVLIESGSSYVPRCVMRTVKRVDYDSSRGDQFYQTTRYDVEVPEPSTFKQAQVHRYASYRQLSGLLSRIIRNTRASMLCNWVTLLNQSNCWPLSCC